MRVDVCIATYRRPQSLRALLECLACQEAPNLTIRVVVVDNDPEQSARLVVSSFVASNQLEVIYDVEPQPGLSFVRNQALRNVTADYFAFLDDDETVSKTWLVTMFAALTRFQADAVFGPVHSALPAGAPQWAIGHPSFSRPTTVTGTILTHGVTGNVLVRSKSLGTTENRLWFDPHFAATGGEDSDFFSRLHRSGAKLVSCNEAAAFEEVPLERLSVSWVCRRAFRGGQGYARVFVARETFLSRVAWFLRKPLELLGGAMSLPLLRIFSHPAYVRMLCRVCSAAGQLSILLGTGVYYQEYARGRYRTRPTDDGTTKQKKDG